MNIKFDTVKLLSEKTEQFNTNQYRLTFNSTDYVCWTPFELEENKLYKVEFLDEKKVKDGDEYLMLQKVKVMTVKSNDAPSPLPPQKTTSPTTTPVEEGDALYHKMAMDFLWKTNKLSLASIKRLAPHFKSICDGTIDEHTLGLLDLEFYDATAVI